MEARDFARFLDISLPVDAIVRGPSLRVRELLALSAGSIIATALPAGENVTILAGSSELGKGELVATGQRPSVRMVCFRGSE